MTSTMKYLSNTHIIMTIQEIKQQLNIENTLSFDFTKTSDGNTSTEWLRAWDNDTRTDIHMHVDVDDRIQSTSGLLNTLHIHEQSVKQAAKGEYTFVRIVARGRSQY